MNYMEQYIFAEHDKNINKEFESFAKKIMSMQSADTFTMLFATDVHYIRRYALYVPSYYKLKEMVDFSGYIGADLLTVAGDIVDGNTTLDRQYRDLYDTVSLIRNSKTTSVVISKGNHDDCSWYAFKNGLGDKGTINEEQWFTHVINPIRVSYPMVLDDENPTGGYYYIDYPFHKIRVINLNTNDVPLVMGEDGNFINHSMVGQYELGICEKQLNWLANKALRFDEEGWSVIIVSHSGAPIDKHVRNRELVSKIISAFKSGEKGTAVGDIEYFEANVSYDFTTNKSSDLLCWLAGHNHKDTVTNVDGITVITTKNLLGDVKNPAYDNEEISYGSWDCMMIDKKNRKFISKRYNQPQFDREIQL